MDALQRWNINDTLICKDVVNALEWPSHKIIKERLDRKKKALLLQPLFFFKVKQKPFILHLDCSETIRNNLHS